MNRASALYDNVQLFLVSGTRAPPVVPLLRTSALS